jgi:hypothetical protein
MALTASRYLSAAFGALDASFSKRGSSQVILGLQPVTLVQ